MKTGRDWPWGSAGIFGLRPSGTLGWNIEDDGKLTYRIEQPEYLEALEWIRKLFDAGVVHPDDAMMRERRSACGRGMQPGLSQGGTNAGHAYDIQGVVAERRETNGGDRRGDRPVDVAPGRTGRRRHTVRLVKRNDTPGDTSSFGGFVAAPGGAVLSKPPARHRQIEFMGDSLTVGYGNLSTSHGCTWDQLRRTRRPSPSGSEHDRPDRA